MTLRAGCVLILVICLLVILKLIYHQGPKTRVVMLGGPGPGQLPSVCPDSWGLALARVSNPRPR